MQKKLGFSIGRPSQELSNAWSFCPVCTLTERGMPCIWGLEFYYLLNMKYKHSNNIQRHKLQNSFRIQTENKSIIG